MSAQSREQRLHDALVARFAPIQLEVENQSHLHAGHAGAAGGLSHYRVRIVSEAFRGLRQVARHRLVYEALGDMMKNDIHALALETFAPP